MSQFLVTGGAGFIGSNIVEFLLKKGCGVRVLDNFSSGKEANLVFTKTYSTKKFELIRGDIRDQKICDKACQGMDYVLHQAALRSVPKSLTEPISFNDVNINGLVCMLQASLKHKVKRFVFASSSSVYGEAKKFPQTEDLVPQLISPYALTKLAGEHYCRIFSDFHGLSTVCLRYFNVFGTRQPWDDEYAVVIPKFIHCLLNDEAPPIFGTGRQSRDFTYIDNIVSANHLAAIAPGVKHAVLNVGVGENHSVLALVGVLNEIFGKMAKPKLLAKRPGDVFKTHADISRTKRIIKYKPLVNFNEGLKRTVKYLRNHSGKSSS